MFLILLLLFVVLPIAEITVFVKMAGEIGVLSSIGWIVVVSFVGIWLVKRQGLHTLRRLQEKAAAGEAPTRELVNGLLILGAGGLMLFPGFLTDVVGILLLLPPVRALLAIPLTRRFALRGTTFVSMGGRMAGSRTGQRFGPGFDGDVVDAESWDVTDDRPRKELP